MVEMSAARTVRVQRPAGFTVTEILLLSAVMVLILALIIPGMVRSRQAARRTQCLNNLHQLGMAFHNYEHAMNCLPPGCVNETGPIRNMAEGYHLGWTWQLLPYVDQVNLFETVRTDEGAYGMSAVGISTTIPDTYLCPSLPTDAMPQSNSYAGSIGGTSRQITSDASGMLYLNSSIRDEVIEDGRSNTLLAGEVRYAAPLITAGLHWMTGTATTLRSSGVLLNTTDDSMYEYETSEAGGFGSHHDGRIGFLIADGSARFLAADVDVSILQLMGDRADGQMLPVTVDDAWRRTQNTLRLNTVMQKMERP